MRARSPAAEEDGRCLGSCNGDAARPRRPRRRPALPRHHDHAAGDLVGSGGCSLHTAGTTTVWNLAFILRPQVWGRGYAQEVAAAGRHQAWRGPDTENPDPTAELILRTVRALNEDQVHALIA